MNKLLLLLYIVCIAVYVEGCQHESNTRTQQNPTGSDTAETRRYKQYDLFTMTGIDECEHDDTCVIVTKTPNSIILETRLPVKFKLELKHFNKYWYAGEEFDMDKDTWNLCKCESWPSRFDRFILGNTIYDYLQICWQDEVTERLYVKKQNICVVYDLPDVKKSVERDPVKILNKINNILNGPIPCNSIDTFNIERKKTTVKITSTDSKFEAVDTFPDAQIWGGPYGI